MASALTAPATALAMGAAMGAASPAPRIAHPAVFKKALLL